MGVLGYHNKIGLSCNILYQIQCSIHHPRTLSIFSITQVNNICVPMSSPLTTHALNTSTGTPASGLQLNLYRIMADGTEVEIAKASCDDNGRVTNLLKEDDWHASDYRIRFFTRDYFATYGQNCFYPHCDITFTVSDISVHYHVPLLVSPFGYTTYRGS